MDAKIKASFWTDERVENCSKDEKFALLWLISNPARDMCGFTKVSNKRFVFETGLDVSTLEGASKHLPSSIKKLPGGAWFVVNFLRQQFGNGGRLKLGNKVVIAAVRHASHLPEVMREAFFQAYPDLVPLIENPPQTNVLSDAPSIPHTGNRDGVREREREREGAESSEKTTKSQPDPVMIVNAYPRNENRNAAYEEVRRQIVAGEDPAEMMAGTRAIAAIIPQMPSGHLNSRLVSSLTFFREKRWKDDPKTWLRANARSNGETPGPLNLGGRKPVKL